MKFGYIYQEPRLGFFGPKKNPCIFIYDSKRFSEIGEINKWGENSLYTTINLIRFNHELCISFGIKTQKYNDLDLLIFPAIENYNFLKDIMNSHTLFLINGSMSNNEEWIHDELDKGYKIKPRYTDEEFGLLTKKNMFDSGIGILCGGRMWVVDSDIFSVELPSHNKILSVMNRIKSYLAGGRI